MSLLETAIARPVATTLLMAGLTLAGAAAFLLRPAAPVPQIDYPVISVSANMPGAGPQTMAASVATPLERHLGHIAGVTEMTSSSSLGSSRLSLQFDLDRNVDGAQRDIQAGIAAARADLPQALRSNPTFWNANPADVPILIIGLTSQHMTQGQLFEAASNIVQQKLSQVEGVGQVSVGGSALPAVRVELNPLELFKYGISLEDVRAALAQANYNAPKGAIDVDNLHYQIYTNDQSRRAADYRNVIIAYRNGGIVRLADVAQVLDSVEDTRNYGIVNGKVAVQIAVFRQAGANYIELVDKIRAVLPALAAALPADTEMRIVQDRTLTIRTSLHEVEWTLVLTIALVILVVFLFLPDARATLILSISVPVSLVGAFGAMYLLDYTLDNLSLMALTIATGFIVDDAIVVVENVVRHMEEGMPRLRAAILGAREVAFTVVSMSASLIAVFVPILLMGGLVGRMMREFALTLTAAIVISLALSLTATPMLCARLLREHTHESRFWLLRGSESVFEFLHSRYIRSLNVVLRHPRLTMVVLLATVGLNVYLFDAIPKGFFPTQDTGRMRGAIIADQSTSFTLMKTKMEQAIAILQGDPGIASATGTIGGRLNAADLLVTLKPLQERGVSADQIMTRLRPQFARVSGASIFLQSVQDIRMGGRSSSALFQYTLQGDDLDELRLWAPRLTEALRRSAVLTDVNSDQQDKGLQTEVTIDRATASRLKLSASVVDNTLYDAFGQRQVSTIYEPLNQYHVVMEVAEKYRETPNALNDIYLGVAKIAPASGSQGQASSKGALIGTGTQAYSPRANNSLGAPVSLQQETMIPFSAFASLAPGSTPLQVNHQGQSAAVTISFNMAEGRSLSEATAAIDETMRRIGVPTTIRGTFAGNAAGYQDALANQPVLIAAALAAVYIVLGVLYESFLHPITILSTLPSAGVGAFVALMANKTDLSIIAMIGVLLLIGIVKKNAIMLVDFALDAERRRGLSTEAAIREACVKRFRPILMTTMVALLGALPLAIGSGEGAEMRRPLGIAIVGGLIMSQLLTLYTTPVVYLYIDRLQNWLRRQTEALHASYGRAAVTAKDSATRGTSAL
jgi:multidrug efflux pump subunit AcrB